MGRHRRSAADDDAAVPSGARHSGGPRRNRRRVPLPVRAGLLGVSAAVAVGAVAVASGMLPGGQTYSLGENSHDEGVADSGGAPDLLTQGTASADPTGSGPTATPASRGGGRPASPSAPASASPSASPTEKSASPAPSATPTVRKTTAAPVVTTSAPPAPPETTSAAPKSEAPEPATDATPQTAVLTLVNQERSKAGCRPVTLSSSLTKLAQDFSRDMAARNFFDHTDPDGDTPWDRADAAGITNLGGENIARGQADAQAVMDSWMNSEGHRANILNCDYTTLGVGVHIADGGPWWTQDFGF
ncbi:CAP domain-containing protein [Streptomyces sp. NBC_01218]|uniref:CAP domain-containing protein n=1 Tax=Streptomyces sp. NBC_01218 TaxID=2903780 RepID=UPI002E10AC1F|nr:CAP domain-containing protein [Streptomyces sp. NBC_01218]